MTFQDNTQIAVLDIFAEAAGRVDQLAFFYQTLANRVEAKRVSSAEWARSPNGRKYVRAYQATSHAFKAGKKRRAAKYRAAHKAAHAEYMRAWRARAAA